MRFKNLYAGLSIITATMAFGQTQSLTIPNAGNFFSERIEDAFISSLSPKQLVDFGVNNMLCDPVLKDANWGFVIYDPKTGNIINSYNETMPLIPASTTKLLTTEAAVALLGTKFKWTTQLEYSGEIDDNGVLNGNLYIVGSGDPSLGTGKAGALRYSALVSEFKRAISEKGIRKINGDIIIQTAVFKDNKRDILPEGIVWIEHGNYYLPAGATADVDPQKEQSVAKGKSWFNNSEKRYFYVSPFTGKMSFSSEFNGDIVTSKIAEAPAYLANNLRTTLVKTGIGVTGKVTPKMIDKEPEKRYLITAYKSPQLKDIVYDTNQRSDNALAEALLRTCGFQKYGNQTLEAGREAVRNHLQNNGFDMEGLTYFDGSGLSRSNAVTPISQVKFLTKLMKEPYFKDYFESLPIGGQSGTLKRSFAGVGYGQVFAKTGTLNRVKTLAGYLKTNSGKTLAFSLMINNYNGSVAQVKSRMESLLAPAMNL